MRKLSPCLLACLLVVLIGAPLNSAEAGYCPRSKSGKCPTQRTISHKQSEFNAQKRAKLMDEARKICKRKYGAASTVYKLDYFKWRVICSE
jgi:hypothetical protein